MSFEQSLTCMPYTPSAGMLFPLLPDDSNAIADCLSATPVESVAFSLAALAARIFIPCLSVPLLGIAAGVLTTKLVWKFFDRYNAPMAGITKIACRFNKKHPKLQLITFIFTLAISCFSQGLGLLAGTLLGCFGAVILDVESYKLIQQARRKG